MEKNKIFKKQKLTFLAISTLLLILTLVFAFNGSELLPLGASLSTFSISFDKKTNRLGSGTLSEYGEDGSGVCYSKLGNEVNFSYEGFVNTPTYWNVLTVGGSFQNTSSINGMKSISIKRNGSNSRLGIQWSGNTEFDDIRKTEMNFESNVCEFNFNNEIPNYFKVYNPDSSNKSAIVSMEITYSCIDSYATLTLESADSSKGVVSGAGHFEIGKEITIHALPKAGYKFVGWYNESVLVSSEKDYTLEMYEISTTLRAIFTEESYNLVLNVNNMSMGSVEGEGAYDYLEEVTISATANLGYKFVGWYEDSSLISTNNPYTFSMPYNDLEYTAKFEVGYFKATATTESNTKGTVSGTTTVQFNTLVTFTATPKDGYAFAGWYSNTDVLISNSNPFSFYMPNNDISYQARFTEQFYLVTLIANEENLGSTEVMNGVSHAYKNEVTIKATVTNPEDYTFGGWYEENTLISLDSTFTFVMPHKNLMYTAKFVPLHEVVIDYYIGDENTGTFSGQGKYGEGLEYTITSTPKDGYAFVGWYNDLLDLISEEKSITIVMGEDDVYYYASFEKAPPKVGDCFELGDYPQTKVTNSSLIATLNSQAGTLPTSSNSQNWTSYNYYINGNTSNFMWYIDIDHTDGNKYRGVYFTSYRPYYTTNSSSTGNSYQDENGYYTSTVYWFRFEPITWIIKDIDLINGKALLMSKTLIDSQQFYRNTSSRTLSSKTVYANNYEHSDIRAFLNDTFYNTSFSSEEKNMILTTTIDNSAASTGNTSNSYACNNTNDKVFIPSYVEAFNSSYFTSNSARQMKASDYAKSQGIYVYSGNMCSHWWLRSPSSGGSNYARIVYNDGNAYSSSVNFCSNGVLPALFIAL